MQSSINGEDWSESSFSDTVVVPSYFYETSLYKILMFIVAILAVAVLTILLTQRIRRIKYLQLKQQQQINDLKIQAIRSKSIPHFTGNIYNNIDYLIENQQYTDASLYLALLSRIHNKVLQDADKPSHSLREELDFVETYIKLEKLRFKDNLSFTVSVKPGVNLDVQIPIMIIHTYVENAIKHGLMSKKGKGEVSLEIDCNEGGTWIRVKDDGIGREEANRKNKDSTGIGLTIFEKQIELYNLGNRNPILQQVDDLTAPDGSSAGTRFSLYVPFEYTFNF